MRVQLRVWLVGAHPPESSAAQPASLDLTSKIKKGVHQRKVCGPRFVQHPVLYFTDRFFIFTRQQTLISLGMQFRGQIQDAGLCLTSCWRLKLRELRRHCLDKGTLRERFQSKPSKKYWQNIILRRQPPPQKAIVFCYTWEASQCPFLEASRQR
ncbi:hypothetical protein TcCL_NonESM07033 [Trypanosoma cruzi]|nr:hypothetical protein TcCL_NonESM07033 [Trypanosoma cruzi]